MQQEEEEVEGWLLLLRVVRGSYISNQAVPSLERVETRSLWTDS